MAFSHERLSKTFLFSVCCAFNNDNNYGDSHLLQATLSLIAGVFSMNAKEINGWENRSLNDIVRIMGKPLLVNLLKV